MRYIVLISLLFSTVCAQYGYYSSYPYYSYGYQPYYGGGGGQYGTGKAISRKSMTCVEGYYKESALDFRELGF